MSNWEEVANGLPDLMRVSFSFSGCHHWNQSIFDYLTGMTVNQIDWR